MQRKNVKAYECKIGSFYRFDYVSSSPRPEYADPIRVDMVQGRKLSLIAGVQADAGKRETVFAALLAETDKAGGLSDMQIRLADVDGKRPLIGKRRANKSAEQKDLEAAIDAEWQRLIGSKRTGATMETGEQAFYRQYKADKIQLSDAGKYYALLVSKTISKKGEILFTFLKTSPVTWSKAKLDGLSPDERGKLETVAA